MCINNRKNIIDVYHPFGSVCVPVCRATERATEHNSRVLNCTVYNIHRAPASVPVYTFIHIESVPKHV